jgi:hypothetical protein
MRKWRAANPEKVKATNAKFYEQNKASYIKRNQSYYQNNWVNVVLAGAKRRARKMNLPFDLKIDDIKIPDVCPALGIPIYPGDGTTHDGSPSLDRIIPELGYIKGNVVVISHKANRIKSNGSLSDLEAVVAYVKQHL